MEGVKESKNAITIKIKVQSNAITIRSLKTHMPWDRQQEKKEQLNIYTVLIK